MTLILTLIFVALADIEKADLRACLDNYKTIIGVCYR